MATSLSISSSDCDGHGSLVVDVCDPTGLVGLLACGTFRTPVSGELAISDAAAASSVREKKKTI